MDEEIPVPSWNLLFWGIHAGLHSPVRTGVKGECGADFLTPAESTREVILAALQLFFPAGNRVAFRAGRERVGALAVRSGRERRASAVLGTSGTFRCWERGLGDGEAQAR